MGWWPHMTVAGAAARPVLGLDETAADRVPRQLDAVTHPELLEDVRAVAVHGALEHVAGRADLDRLEQVLLVVVHRQHQHADLGLALADLPRRLQPGLPRHGDVEDRQLKLLGEGPLDGLLAVARLGDDFEVRLRVEHGPESPEYDGMVVRHEHAALQRRGHAMSRPRRVWRAGLPCRGPA